MKRIKFYKDPDNRWYADLPEWAGSKADLEMIPGADVMLDYMADGEDKVELYMQQERFAGADRLDFNREAHEWGNGAYYTMESYKGIELLLFIYLCDVTKFVFGGGFPETIWIAKVED